MTDDSDSTDQRGGVLNETLQKLETNISEALKIMEISIQDTLKTIQNSRKELK